MVQKNCIICLENKTNISECTTCIESVICHDCEYRWSKYNNPHICTICKKTSRINTIYNPPHSQKCNCVNCPQKCACGTSTLICASIIYCSIIYT